MGLLLKRTSKSRESFSKNSRVVTKAFDLGDPSMTKKFSACNVSYKAKGNGISPIILRYKIDNDTTWRAFSAEASNPYSTGSTLMKTSNQIKTAVFKFPKRSVGRKVSIKIQHDNSDVNVEKFEIVDISFTYRGINRK